MAAERYIILPKRGVRAVSSTEMDVLTRFPRTRSTEVPNLFRLEMFGGAEARVVDTVAEDGPKLVDIEPQTAALINATESPVRAVKEVFYPLPQPAEGTVNTISSAAGSALQSFDVEVVDAATGVAIAGCAVTAFSNFQARLGTRGFTDAAGRVRLSLPATTIERIVASPSPGSGFWSGYRQNIAAVGTIRINVPPLVLPYTDSVRHYLGNTNFISGTGVLVGVIDTGCGPHADLNIVGGRNTVTGEPANAMSDGHYHGTHVAGLVGARGVSPSGIRGVAPGVKLHAYRVFGSAADFASNYAILKAMIFAGDQGCDIVNLSLGGGPHSEIVEEAIVDARNQGMLVVVAAGNDYRSAVSYPAAYTGATAVSAMGREGTVPAGSSEELQIVRPPQSTADSMEFIAHFSNVGPQIAVTAPGVGAISTLPNNKIGPLSGTSMAAPVVAGAAACLLSQSPNVWNMARNRARSDAIERLIQTNCGRRGFGMNFEGYGLPQSPLV